MKYFDYIFKTAIIIIAIVFLFLYYLSLDNNRYTFKYDDNGLIVFDNRTGIIYYGDEKTHGWIKASPFSKIEKKDVF